MIKRIILVAFIALHALFWCIAICEADSVTLAWDANNPTPDGYNLYQRVDGEPYDYTRPVNTGPITGTTYTVEGLAAGAKYFFVARAFVGNEESGDSNEASFLVTEKLCINLLHVDGSQAESIHAGTFLIDGNNNYIIKIEPVPEDNDKPAYSVNSDHTIFHGPSCRHYDPAKGATTEEIEKCLKDGACRACKICGGQ